LLLLFGVKEVLKMPNSKVFKLKQFSTLYFVSVFIIELVLRAYSQKLVAEYLGLSVLRLREHPIG
jgi:hypothetical protein